MISEICDIALMGDTSPQAQKSKTMSENNKAYALAMALDAQLEVANGVSRKSYADMLPAPLYKDQLAVTALALELFSKVGEA